MMTSTEVMELLISRGFVVELCGMSFLVDLESRFLSAYEVNLILDDGWTAVRSITGKVRVYSD